MLYVIDLNCLEFVLKCDSYKLNIYTNGRQNVVMD